MIRLYKERYSYNFPEEEIRKGFTDFTTADEEFDPVDQSGKHWELIKPDFVNWSVSE